MPFETSNLPLASGVVLAVALHAGVSLFVLGPLIGGRMVEKSGWAQACPAALREAIDSERPGLVPIPQIPQIDCRQTAVTFLGPEAMRLCDLVESLPTPPDPAVEAAKAQRRAAQAQNRRLDRIAAMSATRCSCAASMVVERERTGFALHAGSARLITPAALRDLDMPLRAALASAPCSAIAGS